MASSRIQALFNEDWQWEILDNPEFGSQAGEHDLMLQMNVNRLQDLSPAGYAMRANHSKEMIEKANAISGDCENELTKQEKIFLKLFLTIHVDLVKAIEKCKMFLFPINSIGAGCITYSFSESVEWMRFETQDDYQFYLNRLRAFPQQVDDFIISFKEGLRTNIVASSAMVRNIEAQLNAIIASDLPDLFAPLTLPEAVVLAGTSLKSEIENAILATKIDFARFLEFFKSEYLPHTRENPGCNALVNGEEMYALCLKFHTTTDLSADEIHNIGLAEVAKIEQRYRDDVLIPLGFDPEDFPAFVEHTRTDRQFYVNSSEELLKVYEKQCARITEILPRFFNEFPRSPLAITSKTAGPAAYYLAGTADGKRPGRFYVNVSHIEKRPVFESPSLALHEGIPGHHHQVALALENEAMPKFLRFIEDRRYEVCPCRRNLFSCFMEGWALYCEYLGEEMGVYLTPYDIFGRLSMDMMRAVRLVVDTGLHSKGWSIEQAIDYMMQKTGMHRHEVEVEIYRYASWPGQACAYKVGQIEILRLRRRAEAALGTKFNLKQFHTVCLGSGPVPLSLLGDMIDDYINETLSQA